MADPEPEWCVNFPPTDMVIAGAPRVKDLSTGEGTDMNDLEARVRASLSSIERRDPVLREELEEVRRRLEGSPRVESIGASIGRLARDRINLGLAHIVHGVGRPVLQVSRDEAVLEFRDAESEVWRERLTAAREQLARAIRAVGRIELEGHLDYDWIGTGFLVCKDVIATNQHVAREFAERNGSGFVFRRNVGGQQIRAWIDFLEEAGNTESLAFRIRDILHLEEDESPDLALLRVEPEGQEFPAHLKLSSREPVDDQMVAAIGYPARDSRIRDQQVVKHIFGDIFDKKRLSPGMITGFRDGVLEHDCSTLNKSSGSAVVDLASGEVVGLHFGGCYLKANYAVPSRTIAEFLRTIGCDEAAPDSHAVAERRAIEALHAPPAVAEESGASITIPLRVTVSADTPVAAPTTASSEALASAPERVGPDAVPVAGAASKFTLEITFRCMCCFVPDNRTGSMHVLMPDMRGHEHAGHGGRSPIDPHVVRIIYPKEGGSLLDGTAEALAMEEWALELPGSGRRANLSLPFELVDLCPIAGAVSPALLGDRRDPRVVSRISLHAGGVTKHVSGAIWRFNGQVREMAQEITWTIPDLGGDRLTWRRTRLKTEGPSSAADVEDLPEILPADDGIVRLQVHHVLASDFPKADENRTHEDSAALFAAHFAAHYNLIDNPRSRPRPEFDHKPTESPTITCIPCSVCLAS